MGLVLIITGGAVVVLKAYNAVRATPLWTSIETTLRQQAAVVGTLAGLVFALLDALEKGKVIATLLSAAAPASNTGSGGQQSYGGPVGARGLAEIAVRGVVPG